MSAHRAVLSVIALGALVLVSCGSDADPRPAALPPAPAGLAWETSAGFSFLHPVGWEKEARQPRKGETFVAYTGPVTAAGVTAQIGLGTATGYPNALADAVKLNKLDHKARYPGYKIVKEGPLKLSGASAYRVEGTYLAFTKERPPIRIVDILVQTPQRVQASFYVLSADADFKPLDIERLARSLRVR